MDAGNQCERSSFLLSHVQSIVGHMSPEMTKHYSDHAKTEDKRHGMERLSFFTQDALPAAVEEPERAELRRYDVRLRQSS